MTESRQPDIQDKSAPGYGPSVRITAKQAVLAASVLDLRPSLRSRLAESRDGLTLTDDEVDLLLDVATTRLAQHGFDEGYAVNPEGAALEGLIDLDRRSLALLGGDAPLVRRAKTTP